VARNALDLPHARASSRQSSPEAARSVREDESKPMLEEPPPGA
jgi:hypothetical protein